MPLLLRLPFLIYGYGLGFLWYFYLLVQRMSVTVQPTGLENLPSDSNHIFCQWHESIPLSFQGSVPRLPLPLRRQPHAWMQHPAWYMKPVHVLLRLIGVEHLIMGSTGNDGRRAADELVSYLKGGYSTMIAPDGPGGPARVLKKGVLHIALQSGVPIVPVRVVSSKCIRMKSWDRKMQPLPFSTIRAEFGTPIRVTDDNFDRCSEKLTRALG